jgi:hypothetical protein
MKNNIITSSKRLLFKKLAIPIYAGVAEITYSIVYQKYVDNNDHFRLRIRKEGESDIFYPAPKAKELALISILMDVYGDDNFEIDLIVGIKSSDLLIRYLGDTRHPTASFSVLSPSELFDIARIDSYLGSEKPQGFWERYGLRDANVAIHTLLAAYDYAFKEGSQEREAQAFATLDTNNLEFSPELAGKLKGCFLFEKMDETQLREQRFLVDRELIPFLYAKLLGDHPADILVELNAILQNVTLTDSKMDSHLYWLCHSTQNKFTPEVLGKAREAILAEQSSQKLAALYNVVKDTLTPQHIASERDGIMSLTLVQATSLRRMLLALYSAFSDKLTPEFIASERKSILTSRSIPLGMFDVPIEALYTSAAEKLTPQFIGSECDEIWEMQQSERIKAQSVCILFGAAPDKLTSEHITSMSNAILTSSFKNNEKIVRLTSLYSVAKAKLTTALVEAEQTKIVGSTLDDVGKNSLCMFLANAVPAAGVHA